MAKSQRDCGEQSGQLFYQTLLYCLAASIVLIPAATSEYVIMCIKATHAIPPYLCPSKALLEVPEHCLLGPGLLEQV